MLFKRTHLKQFHYMTQGKATFTSIWFWVFFFRSWSQASIELFRRKISYSPERSPLAGRGINIVFPLQSPLLSLKRRFPHHKTQLANLPHRPPSSKPSLVSRVSGAGDTRRFALSKRIIGGAFSCIPLCGGAIERWVEGFLGGDLVCSGCDTPMRARANCVSPIRLTQVGIY